MIGVAELELVAEVVCPYCLKPECCRAGEKLGPVSSVFGPEALPSWGPCEPKSYEEVLVQAGAARPGKQRWFAGER